MIKARIYFDKMLESNNIYKIHNIFSTSSCSQTLHYSSKSTLPLCHNLQDGEPPQCTVISGYNISKHIQW